MAIIQDAYYQVSLLVSSSPRHPDPDRTSFVSALTGYPGTVPVQVRRHAPNTMVPALHYNQFVECWVVVVYPVQYIIFKKSRALQPPALLFLVGWVIVVPFDCCG